jgi:hypothetical protein
VGTMALNRGRECCILGVGTKMGGRSAVGSVGGKSSIGGTGGEGAGRGVSARSSVTVSTRGGGSGGGFPKWKEGFIGAEVKGAEGFPGMEAIVGAA